jgi:type VI secretion system secreted protein Hcp
MAYDLFLRIEGITGDSRDAKHAGWMDVVSFSWGVTMTPSSGTTMSRPLFTDLILTKPMDRASPVLLVSCASGKRFPTAVLQLVRTGEMRVVFMEYTLSDVMLTAYQPAGQGAEDQPLEALNLNAARIVTKYTPVAADGSAGTAITGGWDLRANTKV